MINVPTAFSVLAILDSFLVWWVLALMSIVLLNIRRPRFEAPIFDIGASAVAFFGFVFALTTMSAIVPLLSVVLLFASIIPLALVVGRQEEKEKGVMYWSASIAMYVMLGVLLLFACSV